MATWLTRRRVVGALVLVAVVGGIGGVAALRAARKHDQPSDKDVPVTLQFAPGDLTYVEPRPLGRWLPVSGTGGVSHLVLPAVTLGAALAAILARMTRASVLEELRELYVLAARARGLLHQRALKPFSPFRRRGSRERRTRAT